MITNSDITLYNYRNGSYIRTVINDVFWTDSKQSNIVKSGGVLTDAVSILIPLSSAAGYVAPKEYASLTDITGRFTLQANTKDLVVKGAITYDIDNTSQQTQSSSLTHLKATYDNVVTVNMVAVNLYGSKPLQHFSVSCK